MAGHRFGLPGAQEPAARTGVSAGFPEQRAAGSARCCGHCRPRSPDPLGSGASQKMVSRDLDTIGIHHAPLARLASFAFSPRDLVGARHQRRHLAETIRVITRDPDWVARSVRFVLLAAGIADFTDVLHLKSKAKPVPLLRVQRKSKAPSPCGKRSDVRVSFPEAVPAMEATDKVARVGPCHQYRVGDDCPEGDQSSSRHDCYYESDRINL